MTKLLTQLEGKELARLYLECHKLAIEAQGGFTSNEKTSQLLENQKRINRILEPAETDSLSERASKFI